MHFDFKAIKLTTMRKIVLFVAAIALLALGCRREYNPRAKFTYTSPFNDIEVNDVIHFTNLSSDATSYEWDFGDGTIANSFDASHAYLDPGIYSVTLTAFNGGRSDRYTINIYVSTLLNIKVMEVNTSYVVPNAHVLVYETLADWDTHDSQYAVRSGLTGSDGIVIFEGLLPGNYYIDVYNAHYDNKNLGDHDVSFIKTPALSPGETTFFTAETELISLKSGINRSQIITQKAISKKVRAAFHK